VLLSELGHQVEEVAPPYDDAALGRDFLTIWFAQLHQQVADIKRRTGARDSDFEADTLAISELGRSGGVLAVMSALENRNTYIQSLAEFHGTYDYFLTPTLATPPLEVGATATSAVLQRAARVISKLRAGKLMRLSGILDDLIQESLGWVPYTQLANLTGRPAISVPLHWTEDGLPLGLQFVGKLGADGGLLRLAAQLEEASPWAHRHPAPASD
jgi:Asp-tRNA(Asn)/Glu-tRNA(Gln) amidotransferase A subunit family amidase